MSLGGSLFTHDALRQDYCLDASLNSLLELCEEVVVLDAESTDGTYEYLNDKASRNDHLKIVTGLWECVDNSLRLSALANQARSFLTTQYHFMLQADEVIHENSFDQIMRLVSDNEFDSFICRRWNFWKDANHIVPENSPYAPCSSRIVRLGRTYLEAYGDGESFYGGNLHTNETIDDIQIFHYGLIRDGYKLVDKCLEMQSWFWGKGSNPDPKIIEMKKDGLPFQHNKSIPDEALVEFTGTHPKYAQEWLRERGRL